LDYCIGDRNFLWYWHACIFLKQFMGYRYSDTSYHYRNHNRCYGLYRFYRRYRIYRRSRSYWLARWRWWNWS
jgi:hypothetical protein